MREEVALDEPEEQKHSPVFDWLVQNKKGESLKKSIGIYYKLLQNAGSYNEATDKICSWFCDLRDECNNDNHLKKFVYNQFGKVYFADKSRRTWWVFVGRRGRPEKYHRDLERRQKRQQEQEQSLKEIELYLNRNSTRKSTRKSTTKSKPSVVAANLRREIEVMKNEYEILETRYKGVTGYVDMLVGKLAVNGVFLTDDEMREGEKYGLNLWDHDEEFGMDDASMMNDAGMMDDAMDELEEVDLVIETGLRRSSRIQKRRLEENGEQEQRPRKKRKQSCCVSM